MIITVGFAAVKNVRWCFLIVQYSVQISRNFILHFFIWFLGHNLFIDLRCLDVFICVAAHKPTNIGFFFSLLNMNVEDRIKRHHITINIITVKRTNVMCGSFNVQNVVFFCCCRCCCSCRWFCYTHSIFGVVLTH